MRQIMKRHCALLLLSVILVHGTPGCAKDTNPLRPATIPPNQPFTFVVVGDNRGDSTGAPAPMFPKIIEQVRAVAPALVLNTGDMINGYKDEDEAHLRAFTTIVEFEPCSGVEGGCVCSREHVKCLEDQPGNLEECYDLSSTFHHSQARLEHCESGSKRCLVAAAGTGSG
jgi:hypothetical protein